MIRASALAGVGATISARTPRVVSTPITRPCRIGLPLHVTVEDLEDPLVALRPPCQRRRGHGEPGEQRRQAGRTGLDGLGRGSALEPADALKEEVEKVEPGGRLG